MENKEQNQLKYVVIYSMIMDLHQEKKLDKATAERINSKCAEDLGCRLMTIR